MCQYGIRLTHVQTVSPLLSSLFTLIPASPWQQVCITSAKLAPKHSNIVRNLHAQHIAHHAVNKLHSLGTRENNATKQPSGREPTDCILSMPTLFCYCIIMYFTGFNIPYCQIYYNILKFYIHIYCNTWRLRSQSRLFSRYTKPPTWNLDSSIFKSPNSS